MERLAKITVKLFGPLRQLSLGSELTLEVPIDSSPAELKASLKNQLLVGSDMRAKKLLEVSVLSNEERILCNNDRIVGDCTLALLPPVSGG